VPDTGSLYVVATPIGNLEDMTLRGLRVLREAAVVAAEDTRRTRQLLAHYQIHTPLWSLHAHNERTRAAALVERLLAGEDVALVTDAGTPGISDPGALLVAAAHAAGAAVVPIPGPSAAIAALSVSGLAGERFVFEGFLPRSGKARQERLAALATEPRTAVLYEAPHRIGATLTDLVAACGAARVVAVGRELTKRFEEIWRGPLGAAAAHFAGSAKGEFVLVLAGAPGGLDAARESPHAAPTAEAARAQLASLLDAGVSTKKAAAQVAAACHLPRNLVYRWALEAKAQEGATGE
jgi:16S rRNA (cytidine1402-2'-O)-methyltransferase